MNAIASPFMNPIKEDRIDELAALEAAGYDLPPVIVDGPGEVEETDYPEEKYPFLDGHYLRSAKTFGMFTMGTIGSCWLSGTAYASSTV